MGVITCRGVLLAPGILAGVTLTLAFPFPFPFPWEFVKLTLPSAAWCSLGWTLPLPPADGGRGVLTLAFGLMILVRGEEEGRPEAFELVSLG